jgi:hypothetical protein
MRQDQFLLARAAERAARRLATELSDALSLRGIATDIHLSDSGYDVQVKNRSAALEFGTYTRLPQPVLRSTIERLRAGSGR